jgi:hypothetical protein
MCPEIRDRAPSVLENERSEAHNSLVRWIQWGNGSIFRFILALALAIVGALGAIYVLFFAAGGYFITAAASALLLGVGLIWLSDFFDAPSR